MIPTVPVFTPASAYRTGLLDGAALYRPDALPRPAAVLRLSCPAWAVQAQRVRMAYLWAFLDAWQRVAEAQPELVA